MEVEEREPWLRPLLVALSVMPLSFPVSMNQTVLLARVEMLNVKIARLLEWLELRVCEIRVEIRVEMFLVKSPKNNDLESESNLRL